jgi:hypothetical protein
MEPSHFTIVTVVRKVIRSEVTSEGAPDDRA